MPKPVIVGRDGKDEGPRAERRALRAVLQEARAARPALRGNAWRDATNTAKLDALRVAVDALLELVIFLAKRELEDINDG